MPLANLALQNLLPMNDEVIIGNSLVVPPCCFAKYISERMLSGGWHEPFTFPFYQRGDVLIQDILPWFVKATDMGESASVHICMPVISERLASVIKDLQNNGYAVFVTTRSFVEGIANIHVDRNTCVSVVLIRSARTDREVTYYRYLTLSGPFSQSIQAGLHLHVLSTSPSFYMSSKDAVRWYVQGKN